jgi:rubrerythrin
MADTNTPTVTAVRKALIAESYGHLESIKRLTAKHRSGETLTAAELDLVEALAKAKAYSYLLAAVLRQVEAFWGAAEADEMARLFATVMDTGIEVLEDANDDLDDVETEIPEHLTTLGCHKCGTPFTLPDEAREAQQQPGTVYCRGCTNACHEDGSDHRCAICTETAGVR